MDRFAPSGPRSLEVYLESGRKRVFAGTLDWPGWCRSAKSAELALEALATYAPRYAVVAHRAGLAFETGLADDIRVVETVPGSATTDFGAPDAIPTADRSAVDTATAGRLAVLVSAAWAVFDRVAEEAPEELRKGPRGGGRDRSKMVDHVLGADVAYARMLGIKHRQPAIDDQPAITALRTAVLSVIGTPWDSSEPAERGWPPRFAARRIAWHALDHAWEIEDRS